MDTPIEFESLLEGGNIGYLEVLYERFLQNPDDVSAEWQAYFYQMASEEALANEVIHSQVRDHFREYRSVKRSLKEKSTADVALNERVQKQVKVLQMINAYRFNGHLKANINPLSHHVLHHEPSLSLAFYGLTQADLSKKFHTGSLHSPDEMTLEHIIKQLKRTYSSTIGTQYMHISSTDEKRWIQHKLESTDTVTELADSQRRYILERITAAETLERYLHTKYVGQKRFSLEGGESLIPLLDDLIQNIGAEGGKEVVIGMAHRGRLNVLVNILGKSPAMLFKEFEGTMDTNGRTGDVKYHQGYSSDMNTPGGVVHVALAFNPSHLEIVGPVVEGSIRARQDGYGKNSGHKAIPVVIHGDAAFAGQGVVMETLNMSNTRGYKTRGTIRIIINNQIGFTTSTQKDARSTRYCSDIAKMVDIPVFHVNGDDPEAVVRVSQMALEYRNEFQKDVVIDLVCYRRHGHNEADEPAVTQPEMYKNIRALSSTRERYAKQLVNRGTISPLKAEDMILRSRQRLEIGEPVVPHLLVMPKINSSSKANWEHFQQQSWQSSIETRISEKAFKSLGQLLCDVPDGFELHPRVQKIINARRLMAENKLPIDWGFGETLAYASLLVQGFPVRLSGQDSERGTFFHRHSVLHDCDTGELSTPLKELSSNQATFTVINSLLSELAVLGFEYGYATTQPDTLVLWEAQFGDFANGAQVVIDQFIASGEQKWGRLCGLVMLLPHGFEGMGPEHSSARLERYLQLCAQDNIQICIPTTPAQTFHMLRRQMLRPYRKPLIVFTPKSLLRHPLAVSDMQEFVEGEFHRVIDEVELTDKNRIDRIVFCSGKVFFDLLERRHKDNMDNVAIIRIEQQYPFPEDDLLGVLTAYTHVAHYVWCQEEPLNQGAWYSQQHHYRQNIPVNAYLELASRPASASPAVGNLKMHQQQQQAVVEKALGITEDA